MDLVKQSNFNAIRRTLLGIKLREFLVSIVLMGRCGKLMISLIAPGSTISTLF